MESKRQLKFSRLLQKELAEIFQRDTKSMFGQVFITVTKVTISPDLGVAKAYLSMMLTNDKEETLAQIKDQSKAIRNLLGARIRKDVRIVPEVIFYIDDSADYAIKMAKIIDDLHIPPTPTEEN